MGKNDSRVILSNNNSGHFHELGLQMTAISLNLQLFENELVLLLYFQIGFLILYYKR